MPVIARSLARGDEAISGHYAHMSTRLLLPPPFVGKWWQDRNDEQEIYSPSQ